MRNNCLQELALDSSDEVGREMVDESDSFGEADPPEHGQKHRIRGIQKKRLVFFLRIFHLLNLPGVQS